MNEETSEKIYPVKTLHEFLAEISKEWHRFKRGTSASLFFLSMALISFIPLFFRAVRLEWDIFAYIFLIGLAAFLIYSMHLMIAQYRFFRKWEHRMEHLVNLEKKIMQENIEDDEK